jgi:hypothetical protein
MGLGAIWKVYCIIKGVKDVAGGVCRTACVKDMGRAGVSRYVGKMLRGVREVTKNDGECVNVWFILSSLLFEWS